MQIYSYVICDFDQFDTMYKICSNTKNFTMSKDESGNKISQKHPNLRYIFALLQTW